MSFKSCFCEGISIISKYLREDSSIGVCESSSICAQKLLPLSEKDLDELEELGWDAHNLKSEDSGIAYYHKLPYFDY